MFESPCSDAASEAARLPLLPAGRGSLPTWRAGRSEGVTFRSGLGHRGERRHRKPVAQCHRSAYRPTSEPRAQKPLGHPAQPGSAVSTAAAWAQVSTLKERSAWPWHLICYDCSTNTQTSMLVTQCPVFVFHRPSASALLTHAFFKQVGFSSKWSSVSSIDLKWVTTDVKFCAVLKLSFVVLWQVKRHTRDSFLSLMYPAVPLTSPEDPPVSCPPAPSCHAPTSASTDTAEAVWDF